MNVEVRKIARYDPTMGGKYTRYAGYCLSTQFAIDPPLIGGAYEEVYGAVRTLKGNVVLHSSLLRGRQTAKYISKTRGVKSIKLPELNEIPFSLAQLVTEDEYAKFGSNLVRERFIRAFEDDSLLEKRADMQERVKGIYDFLRELDEQSVTLVSHSFFMKVLEATVENVPIFEEPSSLSVVLNPEQRTYPYGTGFNFTLNK